MSKKLRLDEILKRLQTRLEEQNPEMFPKSFGMSKSSDSDDLKSVDLKGLESDDDVNTGPKSLKIDMETKLQNLLKEQFPTLEQVLLVISSQLNHIQNENLNNFMDLWAELRQKSGEGADFNMVISEKELASMEISFKKKFEILKNDFEREKMAHKNTQFTLQKSQIELFAKNREIEKLQERIQELEKTENEQKSIKSLAEEFEKLKIGMLGDQEPSESARIEELEDLLEESDAKILDLQEELEDVKTKMFEVKTENHHLKIEADELGGELESEIFRFSEKLEFANGKIKMMDLKIRNLRKDSDEKIQKLKYSEFKKVQEILKLHHRLQTEDFGSDHKVQESLKLLENQKNLEIAELKDMLSNQGKRFQLEVEEKMILEAELQKLQTTLEEKNELRKKWAAELSSSFESTRAALKEQLKTVPMSSNFPTLQKTLEEKKGAEPNLDLKALQATLMEQMKMYLAHSKNAGDNSQSSSKS